MAGFLGHYFLGSFPWCWWFRLSTNLKRLGESKQPWRVARNMNPERKYPSCNSFFRKGVQKTNVFFFSQVLIKINVILVGEGAFVTAFLSSKKPTTQGSLDPENWLFWGPYPTPASYTGSFTLPFWRVHLERWLVPVELTAPASRSCRPFFRSFRCCTRGPKNDPHVSPRKPSIRCPSWKLGSINGW